MKRYFGLFGDLESIELEFDVKLDISDENIEYALYTNEDYSGAAVVVFTNNEGELMVVEGGHCSCYGLEGQWIPQKTSWSMLMENLRNSYDYRDLYKDERDEIEEIILSHLN